MGTAAVDRYRRWFAYEKDSHAKVLASLATVTTEGRSCPSFQKAVDILAHVVAARRVWLVRFGEAEGPAPELFPASVPFAELEPRLRAMEAAWDAFLGRLDDDRLAQTFEYKSLDAGRFRNTVEDTSSSATRCTTAARSPRS
jgi:uncharacterized damage-inducible protein DinB